MLYKFLLCLIHKNSVFIFQLQLGKIQPNVINLKKIELITNKVTLFIALINNNVLSYTHMCIGYKYI